MGVEAVEIIDAGDGSFVPAELHNDLAIDTLFDVEDQWNGPRLSIRAALRSAAIPVRAWPESLHWDWGRKSFEIAGVHDPADARVMGVRRGRSWEAAMVTLRRHDEGGPLLYVEYIEVAPWNWSVEPIGLRRRHATVGSILLEAAVRQSASDGFAGRVGPHSLPQAEAFHRSRRFTFVRRDADKQHLAYYERPATPSA